MPGGNKKVTHTETTFLLPPGIKRLIVKAVKMNTTFVISLNCIKLLYLGVIPMRKK